MNKVPLYIRCDQCLEINVICRNVYIFNRVNATIVYVPPKT